MSTYVERSVQLRIDSDNRDNPDNYDHANFAITFDPPFKDVVGAQVLYSYMCSPLYTVEYFNDAFTYSTGFAGKRESTKKTVKLNWGNYQLSDLTNQDYYASNPNYNLGTLLYEDLFTINPRTVSDRNQGDINAITFTSITPFTIDGDASTAAKIYGFSSSAKSGRNLKKTTRDYGLYERLEVSPSIWNPSTDNNKVFASVATGSNAKNPVTATDMQNIYGVDDATAVDYYREDFIKSNTYNLGMTRILCASNLPVASSVASLFEKTTGWHTTAACYISNSPFLIASNNTIAASNTTVAATFFTDFARSIAAATPSNEVSLPSNLTNANYGSNNLPLCLSLEPELPHYFNNKSHPNAFLSNSTFATSEHLIYSKKGFGARMEKSDCSADSAVFSFTMDIAPSHSPATDSCVVSSYNRLVSLCPDNMYNQWDSVIADNAATYSNLSNGTAAVVALPGVHTFYTAPQPNYSSAAWAPANEPLTGNLKLNNVYVYRALLHYTRSAGCLGTACKVPEVLSVDYPYVGVLAANGSNVIGSNPIATKFLDNTGTSSGGVGYLDAMMMGIKCAENDDTLVNSLFKARTAGAVMQGLKWAIFADDPTTYHQDHLHKNISEANLRANGFAEGFMRGNPVQASGQLYDSKFAKDMIMSGTFVFQPVSTNTATSITSSVDNYQYANQSSEPNAWLIMVNESGSPVLSKDISNTIGYVSWNTDANSNYIYCTPSFSNTYTASNVANRSTNIVAPLYCEFFSATNPIDKKVYNSVRRIRVVVYNEYYVADPVKGAVRWVGYNLTPTSSNMASQFSPAISYPHEVSGNSQYIPNVIVNDKRDEIAIFPLGYLPTMANPTTGRHHVQVDSFAPSTIMAINNRTSTNYARHVYRALYGNKIFAEKYTDYTRRNTIPSIAKSILESVSRPYSESKILAGNLILELKTVAAALFDSTFTFAAHIDNSVLRSAEISIIPAWATNLRTALGTLPAPHSTLLAKLLTYKNLIDAAKTAIDLVVDAGTCATAIACVNSISAEHSNIASLVATVSGYVVAMQSDYATHLAGLGSNVFSNSNIYDHPRYTYQTNSSTPNVPVSNESVRRISVSAFPLTSTLKNGSTFIYPYCAVRMRGIDGDMIEKVVNTSTNDIRTTSDVWKSAKLLAKNNSGIFDTRSVYPNVISPVHCMTTQDYPSLVPCKSIVLRCPELETPLSSANNKAFTKGIATFSVTGTSKLYSDKYAIQAPVDSMKFHPISSLDRLTLSLETDSGAAITTTRGLSYYFILQLVCLQKDQTKLYKTPLKSLADLDPDNIYSSTKYVADYDREDISAKMAASMSDMGVRATRDSLYAREAQYMENYTDSMNVFRDPESIKKRRVNLGEEQISKISALDSAENKMVKAFLTTRSKDYSEYIAPR